MIKFSHAVIIFFIILLNVSSSYAKIPEIVLNQKRAVVTVYINDKYGKQISTGSGFVIDSNGIIATNYHVVSACVEDGNTLLIKMENGAFFPLINIVNYDEENDVAIFKVDGKELPTVRLAKNYKPKQGEDIVVVGSPLGLETTVSDGIISSIRGKDGIIQITAPVSPGSSGSPVLNSTGEVIGVATFNIGGKQGGQSLNFAIPVKHVANLLNGNAIPKKKKIVDSKPLPAPAPAPLYEPTAADIKKAEEWFNKAFALWDGAKYTNPNKVIAYLNSAIRLNPSDAASYHNRGLAYANLGQYQQAVEDYSNAIRLKRDNAEAYLNRGLAYSYLGQHQRSIEDYNEVILINPDIFMAYGNRAFAYAQLGEHQRAIDDYTEAIRLKPDFPYYDARGLAYLLLGNKKFGCGDAQKACEMGSCNVLEWAKSKGYCP